MFFRCFFCTVRLSIFERFVFASFEPLRFCKKVRFVFPDLNTTGHGREEGGKYFPRIYSPIRLTEELYIALRHPVNAMGHGREGGLNTIPIMPHHSLAVLRRVLAMPRGTRQGRGVEMFPLSRERWKVGNFMSCAV
mgnify:CR=1 FL=1